MTTAPPKDPNLSPNPGKTEDGPELAEFRTKDGEQVPADAFENDSMAMPSRPAKYPPEDQAFFDKLAKG
jgi:hypothetical protein